MRSNRRPIAPVRNKPARRPLDPINRILQNLGIPHSVVTIVGIGGLLAGTVALALVVAVVLRAVISKPIAQQDDGPWYAPNATPNPDFMAPTLDVGSVYQWQGNEPVTVLLMGADTRPSERGVERPRSDTMILTMLDPVNKRASMLSIPRDLFVDVPGYGLNRVNTAYFFGGSDLAINTVQYNLGIRVNYYAMIEFNVFVRLVDEIGGVDVVNQSEIYDARYPTYDFGYEVFYLPAGAQHLDGETALKYARTRHGNSDFDRAQRQQQLIFAIRDKVTSLNMLPTLVQKAPSLYSEIGSNVDTNLSLDQMTRLVVLAADIPKENIRTGVIDSNYVISYETPEGAQVEIPNRANIGELLTYVFWLP